MNNDSLAAQFGGTPTNPAPTGDSSLAAKFGGTPVSGPQPKVTSATGAGMMKDIGNFLFPIVGDIKHDIEQRSFTGNGKSVLQQVGDLALSALPFIPGLGEAGEAMRVAKVGVEGAGMLSKGLEAFRAASPVVKGAITGYGAGVASDLSQGKDVVTSVLPNLNKVVTTVLGAGAPFALGKLNEIIKGTAGLTPDIENELMRNVTPEEAKTYLSTVKERGVNLRAPTAVDVATDQFDIAAEQVAKARKVAGEAVGKAKLDVGQQPIDMTQLKTVVDDFHTEVQDRYGITLAQDKKGNIVAIKDPMSKRVVTPDVEKRLIEVAKQLNSLQDGTLGNASDVAANISDLVDYSKKDLYGNSNDPLEGLIKMTDGGLRDTINKTSPEMASANAKFIEMKNLENDIKNAAGNKLQRGNLLIRRATAGNSADAQELFDRIYQSTGIDLTKHAILAKWATDVAGNASEQSLFTQAVKEGIGPKSTSIIDLIKMLGKYGANKIASPERVGLNAITGGGAIKNLTPWATKGSIESGRAFTDLLKK